MIDNTPRSHPLQAKNVDSTQNLEVAQDDGSPELDPTHNKTSYFGFKATNTDIKQVQAEKQDLTSSAKEDLALR